MSRWLQGKGKQSISLPGICWDCDVVVDIDTLPTLLSASSRDEGWVCDTLNFTRTTKSPIQSTLKSPLQIHKSQQAYMAHQSYSQLSHFWRFSMFFDCSPFYQIRPDSSSWVHALLAQVCRDIMKSEEKDGMQDIQVSLWRRKTKHRKWPLISH